MEHDSVVSPTKLGDSGDVTVTIDEDTDKADKKIPAKIFLGLWFLGQITMAITGNAGMVAVVAHICGFVLGYITASHYRVEKNVE